MKSKALNFIELTKKGRELAKIIRVKMEKAGTYSPDFDHVIEMLASCIDNYNSCAAVVNIAGFSEMTEKGGQKTMPEAGLMSQYASHVKLFSEQLMLTPRTAGSVGGGKKEKTDPLDGLLKKVV